MSEHTPAAVISLVVENRRLKARVEEFELLLSAATDLKVGASGLAALIVERDHLRRQVTELQEQLTQQVQQRRDESVGKGKAE